MARTVLFILLALIASFCGVSAHRWWWQRRMVPQSCPEDDETLHECYDLRVSIFLWKICHNKESSEEDDSSEEDENGNPCTTVRMNIYYCDRHCCEGYERDANGLCSKDAESDITCYNGGSAYMTNGVAKCSCVSGFSGEHCETPFCSPKCQNRGVCRGQMGRTPTCLCSSGYSGNYCQNHVCDNYCLNGGRCTYKDNKRHCVCPSGYKGLRCEIEAKEGQCPSMTGYPEGRPACSHSTRCRRDSDCSGVQKCCQTKFCHISGMECVPPVNMTCYYAGRLYPMGERFQPDPCRVCKCYSTNKTICDLQLCPHLSCKDTYQPKGECCKKCAAGSEEDETPDGYREPVFKDCPRDLVKINASPDSAYAILTINFKAVNYNGRELGIQGPTARQFPVIHARVPKNMNIHPATVNSNEDEYGHFATCNFRVLVKDIYPPIFGTCPADIYAWEDEIIQWEEPKATDNVGVVKTELLSRYDQNRTFPVGEHVITYMAEDCSGNEAMCIFIITVMKTDVDDSDLPMEMRMRRFDDHKRLMTFVAAPIAGGVLLLAVVIATVCCVRRHKRHHRNHHHHHHGRRDGPSDVPETEAFDNGIYTIYGRPPPAYDSYRKNKPPPTGEVEKPPAYEEIKVKAYDNPVCDTKPIDDDLIYDNNDEKEVPIK